MEAIKYSIPNFINNSVLHDVIENSIVTVTDSLGRIEFANDRFCEILECNSNKVIGETHAMLKSPLHSEIKYKNLWRTIKMGNKWSGILQDTTANGNSLWLDTTIIPVTSEEERGLKYLSIYKDVTKYYKENSRLAQDNAVNNDFLKNIPLNVFNITRRGKILNVNKSCFNKEVSELVGTYIYDYFAPIGFETLNSNIDKVYSDKQTRQFDMFDFDKEGRRVFFSSIISPNFDSSGANISATLTLQEVTQFKGVSNELRASEAKFRTIYKSINVGIIVITDDRGNITQWNKGAEEAFGYKEDETIGRSLTVLMSRKYRNGNIKELIRAVNKIKNKQKGDVIEMCCLRKNGEQFPVEFALSNGSVDGEGFYCAMMLDISKNKSLEEKLTQKTKELELFLYRSAHDLKAPFSSAEGLLGLLKEEQSNERGVLLTGMLDTIIQSGKNLSENLSQASNVEININEFKEIDFSKQISDILVLLGAANKFDNIKFNVAVVDNYSYKCNPEMIKSIIQNLIHNAIKYSRDTNMEHSPFVNIIIKTFKNEVVILIEDNGLGIYKTKIDKIFDLYYRANKYDVPGHGLGLYIVKNMVDRLKGKITVESSVNSGTSFKVVLPSV